MTEQHKQPTQDQIFDPDITYSNASSSSHQYNIEIDNNNNFLNNHTINNNTENPTPSNQQFSVLGSMFTIATNNICGLSALTKQQQLTTYMEHNKYDLLGVSETKLSSQATKLIYKDNPDYTAWWNCFDTNPTSAGVGIIMHNSTAKYVQLVKGYKGRVIFANIYLRGNIKLRIIQVYIQAHTLDKESRLDIDQYVYNNLHQAQQNNFKVIIMATSMLIQTSWII